jgi:hypothetical protein
MRAVNECISRLIWFVKIENANLLRRESKLFYPYIVLLQIEDHGRAVSCPALEASRLFDRDAEERFVFYKERVRLCVFLQRI